MRPLIPNTIGTDEMIDGEYTPNPRLRVLACELALLNETLLKQRLDDRTRLQRMRAFAQASLASGWRIATFGGAEQGRVGLPGTNFNKRSGRWIAKIGIDSREKYLGTFDTVEQAHEAFRAAHVEAHGEASRYHPTYAGRIDDELVTYARTLGLTDKELIDA